MMEKPFAPSCERNQNVILAQLQRIIKPHHQHLLEIGTGTGQHAVFMAPHFSPLQWHTSDLKNKHDGIQMWLDEQPSDNIHPPVEYQAGQSTFPSVDADVVFSVNTLHIMAWPNVMDLIKDLGKHLKMGAEVIFYGPFNYGGQYTSESNEEFDQWLKEQHPDSAIRNFEAVRDLMNEANIDLKQDIVMPANNRLLVFNKTIDSTDA